MGQISPETYTMILNYIDEHVGDKQQAKEMFYNLFEPFYYTVDNNPCIEDLPLLTYKNVFSYLEAWERNFPKKGENARYCVTLLYEVVEILEN